jgi:deoxycytidine triphosphate deaminase
MLLNGAAIRAKGFIKNADERQFRPASYDVRIGQMLRPGGDVGADRVALEPQGILEVISVERIELPTNVVGYAMVKTSLCNDGIFAINIGIIDPGYRGLLSSTLVNLGKNQYPIVAGEVFLRLVFHEFDPQADTTSITIDDKKYREDKRVKMNEKFAPSFLDIPATVSKLSEPIVNKLFERWRSALLVWVPAAAVTVAIMSFLVNWGATWSARNALLDSSNVRREVLTDVRSTDADNKARDERIAELERQLRELNQRLLQLQATAAPRPVVPTPRGR